MPSLDRDPAHTDANRKAAHELRRALIGEIAVSDPQSNLVKRVYEGLDIEKALKLFDGGSPAFFRLGHEFIATHLQEPGTAEAVAATLVREPPVAGLVPLLQTLSSLRLPTAPTLERALLKLTRSDASHIAELAARAIAIRYPHLIRELLRDPTPSVLFGLCYSSNERLISTLLSNWGKQAVSTQPPVTLGLLMTPGALSRIWEADADTGLTAARVYGYLDETLDAPKRETQEKLCALLRAGLMVVDPAFLESCLDDLLARELAIVRSLLPWSTGMTAPVPEDLSFDDRIDQMLLLSAVRASERTNFEQKADENPHSERGRENLAWLEFSYSRISYARKELIEKPRERFERLGCPPSWFPQYAIEYATCRLERDARLQEEQRLFHETRWAHAGTFGRRPDLIHTYPIVDGSTYLELCELVLPKRPRRRAFHEPISAGAEAARALLVESNRAFLVPTLERCEQHLRGILPPIGIEIQVPFPADRSAESLAWKQALRALGIPSPRRPEYRSMVEAAMPPAYSYHSHVVTLLMLRELRLFQTGQDVALHISLAGRLGPEVRHLLFVQQFAAAPTNSPPGQKLMSKGFAHLHEDAVHPVTGKPSPDAPHRTELRSMRINVQELLSKRFPHFIDDIISFQLLGGALASDHPSMRRVWAEFIGMVESEVANLPDEFRRLLDADWYECTGDGFDPLLMPLLDIVQRWRRVNEIVQEGGHAEELRTRFRAIRNAYARAVMELLPPLKARTEQPTHFAFSTGGLPFLNPILYAEA